MENENAFFSGKRPLVILGFIVVILLLFVVWSLKIGALGESFRLEKAVVCRELDNNSRPSGIFGDVPYGSRQICLWLEYSHARKGSDIKISWYYGKNLILSETVALIAKDGTRAFYLLRDEGTPLPVGAYRAVISQQTRKWSDIKFNVVKRK